MDQCTNRNNWISRDTIIPLSVVIASCIISCVSNYNTTNSVIKSSFESNKTSYAIQQHTELSNRKHYLMEKKLLLSSELIALCTLESISFVSLDHDKKIEAFNKYYDHSKEIKIKCIQLTALGTAKQLETANAIFLTIDKNNSEIAKLFPKLVQADTFESHDVVWKEINTIIAKGHSELRKQAIALSTTIREDFSLQ